MKFGFHFKGSLFHCTYICHQYLPYIEATVENPESDKLSCWGGISMLAAFLLKFCTFFCMLIKIQGQIVECTADICSLSEPALNLALNMLTMFYYVPSTDTAKIMAILLHKTSVEILEIILKYLWGNPIQLVVINVNGSPIPSISLW